MRRWLQRGYSFSSLTPLHRIEPDKSHMFCPNVSLIASSFSHGCFTLGFVSLNASDIHCSGGLPKWVPELFASQIPSGTEADLL